MKIKVCILHGTWNTLDNRGDVAVIGVSTDVEQLLVKLDAIADSKAQRYIRMFNPIQEIKGERDYEAKDECGRYVKFYITEHWLELSEDVMGEISREMEKIDRTRDVEQCLRDMYEEDEIPAWKYEYMTRKPKVMQRILRLFEKWESCNIPYNVTLESVIGEIAGDITLNDEILEFLWDEFTDVQVDDDECIVCNFLDFACGTHREKIWKWFDEHYAKGVISLMYERNFTLEKNLKGDSIL